MLSQLVRPLIRPQIELLLQAKSVHQQLRGTMAEWLSYMGVRADVNQLKAHGHQIHVSLYVDRPDQCSEAEWQKLQANLQQEPCNNNAIDLSYESMDPSQQRKVQRLLACIIQAGNNGYDWPMLQLKLQSLGLNESLCQGIRAALKVPGQSDQLLQHLDPSIIAFVLSKATYIMLMDSKIIPAEAKILGQLYQGLTAQVEP